MLRAAQIVFFLLLVFCADAQRQVLRRYSGVEGLGSGVVYSCIEDKDGFIWFGTSKGAVRYDGFFFDRFTKQDGLPDNEVLKVRQDHKGRIWFFSLNGKVSYYYKGSIFNDQNQSWIEKLNASQHYLEIYELADSSIWFLNSILEAKILEDTVVYDIDFTEFTSERNKLFNVDRSRYVKGDLCVYPVFDRQSDEILMLYQGFVLKYDKVRRSVKIKTREPGLYNSSNYYPGMYEREGSLQLVNSNSQLCRYKGLNCEVLFDLGKDSTIQIVNQFEDEIFLFRSNEKLEVKDLVRGTSEILLEDTRVNAVYMDSKKNLWICTNGQGIVLRSNYLKGTRILDDSSELFNKAITAMAIDVDHNIICGHENSGISILRPSNTSEHFALHSNRNYSKITSIVCDKSTATYVSSNSNVFKLSNSPAKNISEELLNDHIRIGGIKDMALDRAGNVFVATSTASGLIIKGKKYQYNFGEHKLFNFRSYCVEIDNNNRSWFATINGLFVVEDPVYHPEKKQLISNEGFTDLKNFRDSMMVGCWQGVGLVLFNGLSPIDTIYYHSDLHCSEVSKISTDNSYIWCATDLGITRIAYNTDSNWSVSSILFGKGLPNSEITSIVNSGDSVFAGTYDGLVILPKSKFDVAQEFSRVYIRKVSGSWGVAKDLTNVVVDYLNNNFLVEFSAINISDISNLDFQYRLNSTSEWTTISARSLALNALPFGQNNLEIRVNNNNGIWSEPIAINLEIKAPFWKTMGFVFLILASALLLVSVVAYSIVKRRIDKLKQLAMIKAERERISADLHDDIGADLTRISLIAEVLREDNTSSEKNHMWDKIIHNSKELRSKTDQIIWALNPSQDNIKDLIAYLNHFGNDFFDSSGINFKMSNQAKESIKLGSLQRRNLFLIFKEAMNNALKHSGATEVELSIAESGQHIIFKLVDNGRGNPNPRHRNGLISMEKRCNEIGGRYEIIHPVNQGFTVKVELPIDFSV